MKLNIKNREKNNLGFSLVELLVIMSVLVTLSVMMVLNFRVSAKNAGARHQVSSSIIADIRKVQAWALTGTTSSGVEVCGYGIHATASPTNSYNIFKKNKNPASGVCPSDFEYDSGDPTIETKIIGNNSFTLEWTKKSGNPIDIFFVPPDPKTYIDGKTLEINKSEDLAIICVKLIGSTCSLNNCGTATGGCADTSKISIGQSGRIDITN